jgi:hypothetical protein
MSVLDHFYAITSEEMKVIEREGILKWLSDNSDRIVLWPPCEPVDCHKRVWFPQIVKTLFDRICHIFAFLFSFLQRQESGSSDSE